MHQYITQLHIISLKQEMAAPLTWISHTKALLEFPFLSKMIPTLVSFYEGSLPSNSLL